MPGGHVLLYNAVYLTKMYYYYVIVMKIILLKSYYEYGKKLCGKDNICACSELCDRCFKKAKQVRDSHSVHLFNIG